MLEIKNLCYSIASENVVASSNPLNKTQSQKSATQFAEANIRVRLASQHSR
jgi:hypothetical protein